MIRLGYNIKRAGKHCRSFFDFFQILIYFRYMENKYNHKEIETKWQDIWEKDGLYKFVDNPKKEKFYILDMFPYPSGTGLHMGHTESYTTTDIIYRFKRMQGYSVLHPQGFDAFGLPAENFAVKTGVHPKETTRKNIENYIKQMKMLGFGYDFERLAITSTPEYYKWTQWIFSKFFEAGLVYKKTDVINWCDSCKTGLANEQIVDGRCERCKNEVTQKEIPGWFFKITEFADELIEDLKSLDWPEHTKKNQTNWIGMSEGSLIKFEIRISKSEINPKQEAQNSKQFFIEVFTTRPDTLFGATYCVLAPENELVGKMKNQIQNLKEVEEYIEKTKRKTEMDRMEGKEKTGVRLEGVIAINPATKEEVPVFIADYVLARYGTGAIMAVPAHDERDFEFAKKFNLSVKQVICQFYPVEKCPILEEAYTGGGKLVASGKFDGMDFEEAKKKITEFVGGRITRNYRLRDWSISRQRYWGAPIPIVYDPSGNAHAIPKEHLPWLLPEDVDFTPTGTSPLTKSKDLKERTEKIFGKGWTPEVDTMDTFVCSSWYYLRYADLYNEKEFCSKENLERWLPVDLYIGGAEHTYMHLLYARFFTKAMRKIGLLDFSEPFLKLRHQGMVLDKNGEKMSKSKGNVVNPDDMVDCFGADATRMYMMFAGPLEDQILWNDGGVVGLSRFLEKVWKLKSKIHLEIESPNPFGDSISKLERMLHQTIKKVGEDLENLKFNTAISQLMILANVMEKESQLSIINYQLFMKLLAPFAPHIAEDLWHQLGNKTSVHLEKWPEYDENLIKEETITYAVQINGKLRDTIEIDTEAEEDEVKEKAFESENIQRWLEGKEIKKVIFVKGRLLNIII